MCGKMESGDERLYRRACCPTRLRSYHFRFRLINDASPDYWLFWVSEQAVAFDVDVDVT